MPARQAAAWPPPIAVRRPRPIVGESALNRALALDPETRGAIARLDGRRIELTLESPPLALQLRVEGERLAVGPVDPGNEPDLAVRTTLAGMLSQLPFLRRDDAPPVGKVRMAGDADLARQLQRLAERFDPDWQQPFAAVFGDVIGVQVAQAFASALRGARRVGGTLARNAAEYVGRGVARRGRPRRTDAHDDVDSCATASNVAAFRGCRPASDAPHEFAASRRAHRPRAVALLPDDLLDDTPVERWLKRCVRRAARLARHRAQSCGAPQRLALQGAGPIFRRSSDPVRPAATCCRRIAR